MTRSTGRRYLFGEFLEEDDENETKDERMVCYRKAPGVTSLHHNLSMRTRTRAAQAQAQAQVRARARERTNIQNAYH
jgi:hypothetical protein